MLGNLVRQPVQVRLGPALHGQLKREHEALLLVKTVESRAAAVQEYVLSHHDYEVPEVLQVAVEGGSPAYLNWLAEQVAQ